MNTQEIIRLGNKFVETLLRIHGHLPIFKTVVLKFEEIEIVDETTRTGIIDEFISGRTYIPTPLSEDEWEQIPGEERLKKLKELCSPMSKFSTATSLSYASLRQAFVQMKINDMYAQIIEVCTGIHPKKVGFIITKKRPTKRSKL